MQTARFDRNLVRDLTWSRHQLEELAERRFLAAQDSAKRPEKNVPSMDELGVQLDNLSPIARTSFQDLFKKVAHADFSSYLAKLQVYNFPCQALGDGPCLCLQT